MSQTHQFLFELGTEELPPKSLLTFMNELASQVKHALNTLGVPQGELKAYASPRRLALWIAGLPERTPQKSVIVWGPPANVAFDAQGKPTKAAEAFAVKNGLNLDQLTLGLDGKQEKLRCETFVGGVLLKELCPDIIQQALAQLPIAKRMRWGAKRDEFVRPVHWLVMLWDEQVIPCQILGVTAGHTTRGHRFHCPEAIAITSGQHYAQQLKIQGKVIADFNERRAHIRQQIIEKGLSLKGQTVIDEDLLNEVTSLVEWPVALAGQFDERFLSVPAEALISSMKEHQKYFHMVDAHGQLMPYFITLANIESIDPQQVIDGNQKVIRPRLSDAAFFFETDKKVTLDQHREKLRNVLFQAQLGSLFDKTQRIAYLAADMANQLKASTLLNVSTQWAERAGQLSKADLATAMVYEFADMQGIAGYYYAQHQGEVDDVARALKEQYLPKFAGDILPSTATGTFIALADRIDTLVGIFGLGQLPTGSKDPFGLRRASLAALRLIVEKSLDLDLKTLLMQARAPFGQLLKSPEETVTLALNYMLDRFHAWYEEQGIPSVVYQAVAAKGLTHPVDINERVQAVAAFYRLPEAAALAAANKRVSNLLSKHAGVLSQQIQLALLQEPAEQQLNTAVQAMQKRVQPLFEQRQYTQALAALAELRAPVDAFFEGVMVMAEDTALRENRLALLAQLRALFWQVADISQLATVADKP